nr:MAG TPA: hypothetical protein [Bacteriophage sp.]
MINAEKYISEILKINNCDFGFNKHDRKIINCDSKFCEDCLFSQKNRKVDEPSCNVAKLKWLISENKEPIKLNRLEYEILKFGQFGYIARDEDGNLFAFSLKPEKVKDIWDCNIKKNVTYSRDLTLFNELFDFIKWEDAEPTSVKEVLNNCEVVENA